MKIRNFTRFITVALLTLGLLLSAGTASASKQALVKLEYKRIFAGFGTTYTRSAQSVVATVATPTPTPSVMWASNIVSGTLSSIFSTTYSPNISRMETFMNKAVTLGKSWSGAAPSVGSVALPPASGTTRCFASIAPFSVGPPALPGSCFPRFGTMTRTPGTKKYGGTARMLENGQWIGTFLAFTPTGLDLFDFQYGPGTSMLTGSATYPGNYGIFATGTFTNTALQTARKTMMHQTLVPWTTGMAKANMTGFFGSVNTLTGSHNFNTANLTGMINMVQPLLLQGFNRNQAGGYLGNFLAFAGHRTVSVTFAGEVPEPGTMLMLGFGALGLGGLAAMRRR